MATILFELNDTVASWTSDWRDVSAFARFELFVFSAADASVYVDWSVDRGINNDLITSFTALAGVSQSRSFHVRSKYARVRVVPAAAAVVRLQSLFFLNNQGLEKLENLGSGAYIYEPAVRGVRSLESSDSSLTVTENPLTIDLTVNGSGVITETDGVFWDPLAGTLYVGNCAQDRFNPHEVIIRADSDQNVATDADGNILYTDAGGFVVCLGYNSQAITDNQISIGTEACYNQALHARNYDGIFAGYGVAYNVDATLTDCAFYGRSCAAGYNAMPSASMSGISLFGAYSAAYAPNTNLSAFGYQSAYNSTSVGTGVTAIGSRAGYNVTGTAIANNEVLVGYQCTPTNTAGRLSFGNNMEAPAAGTEWADNYIKVSWNGTLYFIPSRLTATLPATPSSYSFTSANDILLSRSIANQFWMWDGTSGSSPSTTNVRLWYAPVDCYVSNITTYPIAGAYVSDFSGTGINGGTLDFYCFKFPAATNPTTIASRTDITSVLSISGAAIQSSPYGTFSASGTLFSVNAGELIGLSVSDNATDGGGAQFSWLNFNVSVTIMGT